MFLTCGVSWVADVNSSGFTVAPGGHQCSLQLLYIYSPALLLYQLVRHQSHPGLIQQHRQRVRPGHRGQHTCASLTLPTGQQLHNHLNTTEQRANDQHTYTGMMTVFVFTIKALWEPAEMKMSSGCDNTPPSRLVMNSAMLRLT